MPDQKPAPLNRLLKPREITSLLGDFEILVPGYCLSLCSDEGHILAGNGDTSPEKFRSLLENAQGGQWIEGEDGLVLPLVLGSTIKGGLIAHRTHDGAAPASSREVRDVLSCLNHTLSLLLTKAIETRDVVGETVERYREINLLYHIGETIGTCLDPEKIPQLALQEANRCIQADAGIVLLAAQNPPAGSVSSRNLEVKASIGELDQINTLLQGSNPVIARVTETGQPAITTQPDIAKPDEKAETDFAAIICVPLQVQERTLGMIVLGRVQEHLLFSAGEMKLLMALASQASIALETVRLHLEELTKQRLEEELAISRQIQLSLLPESAPAFPGWEFAASYQAARQVGGDLYDFLQLPNQPDQVGLVIADVAGKGVPAALFMAFCRTILRMGAMIEQTPAQVLKRTNQLILQNSRSDLYLSAFHAQLDINSGELVYANGGHNPPYWFQAANRECRELSSRSYVLGLFRTIDLDECRIQVAPGDVLVFYTDGITEARDSNRDFFGECRLADSILANNAASAQEILDEIVAATNQFMGDAPQSDDFTLFVVKRN